MLIELMNRLPRFITKTIDWYAGLDKFIFFFFSLLSLEKTAFDLLAFCSFSMIKLRYFRGNYILSNFRLLFGLLRLVCLILAGQ